MTRISLALATCLLVLLAPTPSAAAESDSSSDAALTYNGGVRLETEDGNFSLRLNSRLQARFSQFSPDMGDSGGTFDLTEAKLILVGRVMQDWTFRFQTNFAGGGETDFVRGNIVIDNELLEDAYVQWSRNPLAQLRVGQGKVDFGRQFLTSAGRLQFLDRSITTSRFAHGRDVGVSLIGVNDAETFQYSAGIFAGSGIDKDQDENDDYLVAARLLFTPLGPMTLDEYDVDGVEGSRLAIGLSGLNNTVGTEGVQQDEFTRGGIEIAYRVRRLSIVGEYFTESNDRNAPPVIEEMDTDGWYLQAGFVLENGFGMAGRYAAVTPDAPMQEITEAGVAFSYIFAGHKSKLQADYRRLEDEFAPQNDTDAYRLQLQLEF